MFEVHEIDFLFRFLWNGFYQVYLYKNKKYLFVFM